MSKLYVPVAATIRETQSQGAPTLGIVILWARTALESTEFCTDATSSRTFILASTGAT